MTEPHRSPFHGASDAADAGRRTGRRTGRRRGRPETRQTILVAARALFAERGFTGTSIRAVAAAASVDPALVHHYFGTKEGLFRAALEIPVDPEQVIERVAGATRAEVPLRLVETFLSVWESPETGPAMVSVLRRAVAEQGSTDLLRDFIGATVLRTVAGAVLGDVPPEEARVRVTLVVSQMLGVVLLRRVLVLEPLASMPGDRVAATIAPAIAHYLYGDLADLGLDPAQDPSLEEEIS